MLTQEMEMKLLKIKDEKLASEARRFIFNLFVLFDGHPPEHIEQCIWDILDLLEKEKHSRRRTAKAAH